VIGRWLDRTIPGPLLAPEDRTAASGSDVVPFNAHLELLRSCLTHRAAIVERIQRLLSTLREQSGYLQDEALLSRLFEDSFFTPSAITSQSRLRGQLEDAHWRDGFKPREIPGLHNGLIDPAEMMRRGFHFWEQTRWPGRNGRVRYAHTLFDLYVIRRLELLSMRICDTGASHARERLSHVQRLLDDLWASGPDDRPGFVRDAGWLMPLAQSPATDDLGAYFTVAARMADALTLEDRIDIHRAGVRMAGGHLRSQTRYYATKRAVPIDDPGLLASTRTSNALDFGLLIQDLVPLLTAYEDACHRDDRQTRPGLASAICQGISSDPGLFLNRLELLRAYSMIEDVFVRTDGDDAAYTPIGQRHVQLIDGYESLIGRAAQPLLEDCERFRPVAGRYSPYGVLYGFTSDLLEHMALKTAQADAVPRFGLEDVFDDGDADTLAWVTGWRRMPHIAPEVQRLFEYPQQFAEEVFARIERELRRRVSTGRAEQGGRLVLASADDPRIASVEPTPDPPGRYIRTTDTQIVAAQQAVLVNEARFLSERRDAKFLVSYQTPGGWAGISKDVLTDGLGAGRNVKLVNLPSTAARVLTLMGQDLCVLFK
jgi:hypothetical protein